MVKNDLERDCGPVKNQKNQIELENQKNQKSVSISQPVCADCGQK